MNRGWRVAVTKPNVQSNFWHWSVWMQDTNREPGRIYPSIPLKKESTDFEETPELPTEHGILMGNGYGLMQTGKVYRVIGALSEPGIERFLPSAIRNLPARVQQFIPAPKPWYATSVWYEIITPFPAPSTNPPNSDLSQ